MGILKLKRMQSQLSIFLRFLVLDELSILYSKFLVTTASLTLCKLNSETLTSDTRLPVGQGDSIQNSAGPVGGVPVGGVGTPHEPRSIGGQNPPNIIIFCSNFEDIFFACVSDDFKQKKMFQQIFFCEKNGIFL